MHLLRDKNVIDKFEIQCYEVNVNWISTSPCFSRYDARTQQLKLRKFICNYWFWRETNTIFDSLIHNCLLQQIETVCIRRVLWGCGFTWGWHAETSAVLCREVGVRVPEMDALLQRPVETSTRRRWALWPQPEVLSTSFVRGQRSYLTMSRIIQQLISKSERSIVKYGNVTILITYLYQTLHA